MFTFIIYNGQDGEYLQAFMNIESIEQAQKMMPHEHVVMFVIHDEVEVVDAEGNELNTLEV